MIEYIRKEDAIDAILRGGITYHEELVDIWEIERIPAADVAPVVHGEWIVSHIPDSMLWECDQCGFDCGAHSFNFCPNCGAKMDGGESDG